MNLYPSNELDKPSQHSAPAILSHVGKINFIMFWQGNSCRLEGHIGGKTSLNMNGFVELLPGL